MSRRLLAVFVGITAVGIPGIATAQEGALPLIIPVYTLCGEGAPWGSQAAVYSTRIEITMTRQDGDNGEIIVSPDIVAGEINPGETIVLDCSDILLERTSFFGFLMVQLFPADAFSVRVAYDVQ